MTKDEARIIRDFLASAMARIDNQPDALPFPAPQGRLVIGWLGSRLSLAQQLTELGEEMDKRK